MGDGYGGTVEVPLVPGNVYALREFIIDPVNARLKSLNGDYVWKSDWNQAGCGPTIDTRKARWGVFNKPRHLISCSCGFYSYTVDGLRRNGNSRTPYGFSPKQVLYTERALGVVQLAGNSVEGSMGWRSSRAKVMAMWLPDSKTILPELQQEIRDVKRSLSRTGMDTSDVGIMLITFAFIGWISFLLATIFRSHGFLGWLIAGGWALLGTSIILSLFIGDVIVRKKQKAINQARLEKLIKQAMKVDDYYTGVSLAYPGVKVYTDRAQMIKDFMSERTDQFA